MRLGKTMVDDDEGGKEGKGCVVVVANSQLPNGAAEM